MAWFQYFELIHTFTYDRTNHIESFAFNILLGIRLENSYERFVKGISDLMDKKSMTT